MKSRDIPLSTGGTGKVHYVHGKGWPQTFPTPLGLYRVEFNDNKPPNPVRATYIGPAEIVVAERYGPVVVASDGTTWTEGEDVSGGWVCTTEATGCGRIG